FTGCRFIGSNLRESTFVGCTFDYASFERTYVEPDILEHGCPGWENLQLHFARTLRTNFQQIGNSQAVNRAIRAELEATRIHLKKAWRSRESYYRSKYTGTKRARLFVDWLKFVLLDWLWGNGESAVKVVRAVLVLLLVMMFVDVF